MNRILKRFCIFALCSIMCLCAVFPAMAEDVEKVSLGDIEYFFVETDGESEVLTPVESFSVNGTYRAKVDVYNYDDTDTVSAVMIVGLFNKTTHELLDVKFAKNDAIASDTTVSLSADIAVTDYTVQTIDSYVWKSASSLNVLGNTAPTAPTDVTVDMDKITNSTVELSWTASIDDTDSVAYYNVYRNGKYVGSTLGDETTFKDVGIRHNTEVSYTVEAVDAVGAISKKSDATQTVTTDDIARLWFGGIAEGTVIDSDNFDSLLNTDSNAHNVTVTGVTTGKTMTSSQVEYPMSISAHASGYEYDTAAHKSISFGGIDFEQPGSRIFMTLDEEFVESIDNDDEVKVIYNYFDNRVIGYGESSFNTYSVLVRYASNATSAEEIVGATGTKLGTTYRWKSAIATLPTSNNTTVQNNSDTGEYPVFKNRFFDFSTRTTAEATSLEKGNLSAYSMGYPAMFSLGSNNTNHADHFDNVIVSKIEFAAKDYVPYGAVLDFDDESENQFVEMLSRDGYNVADVASATDGDDITKKAIKLRNATDVYPDNSSKAGQYRYIKVGMNNSYITASDNRVIIRITYLDNVADATNGEGLTVAYDSTSGSKASQILKRNGTNKWQTAEFFIENAKLTDALGSLQLGTSAVPGNDWYISRVEVIKR